MLDAGAFITKHQGRGVLVDTNLLVLFLVGQVNRRRITTYKRTEAFTPNDFDVLSALIGHFGRLFATPHLLGEVSNLTDLRGQDLVTIRQQFATLVEHLEEQYDPSQKLVGDQQFARLGLADVSIAAVAAREILVLTADLALQLELQRRGADALNFNHVRALGWFSQQV